MPNAKLKTGATLKKAAFYLPVLLGAAVMNSQAAIDANVTNIVTDTSNFISTLFPVKATIVVAGIAFALVKFLKGR